MATNSPETIYDCKNLTNDLRMEIFNSTVDFQGVPVFFHELFGENSSACEDFSSKEIGSILKLLNSDTKIKIKNDPVLDVKNSTQFVTNKTVGSELILYVDDSSKSKNAIRFLNTAKPVLKIGKKVELRSKFYIERKIYTRFKIKRRSVTKVLTFEELENSKMLLLSNKAGSGKSTTFRHMAWKLKLNLPLLWISYIDLKQLINVFKRFNLSDLDLHSVTDFLSHNILNITTKFDQKVFKTKFLSNDSIFFWDAVDEISPYYKNEILNLIQIINKISENRQWISTRLQHEESIQSKLNISINKLEVFNEYNRRLFIEAFMKSYNSSTEEIAKGIESIEQYAKKLEKPGTESYGELDILDSPQILNMICKQYIRKSSLDSSTNLYVFYDTYIDEIFDAVTFERGEIVRNDTKRIEKQEMFQDIHHYHAIQTISTSIRNRNIFNNQNVNLNDLDLMSLKIKWSNEEISRYGILVQTDLGKLEFEHRTLAEFFFAQYFYKNIWNLNYRSVGEDEAELRLNVLFILINQGEDTLKIILDFISGFIDAHASDTENLFNKTIRRLMLGKFTNLFRYLVKDLSIKDFNDIGFATKFFQKDREILNALWKIDKSPTFFHEYFEIYGARFIDLEYFFSLKEILNRYFDKSDSLKILEGRNQTIKILYNIWKRKYDYHSFIPIVKNLELVHIHLKNISNLSEFLVFLKTQKFSNLEFRNFFMDFTFQIFTDLDHKSHIKTYLELIDNTLCCNDIQQI